LGQVLDESHLGLLGVVSIETVWKVPCLLLSASVGVVLSWVEPVGWVFRLDIGDESNLVDWGVERGFNSDLVVCSIDLSGKTLGD